MSLSPYVLLLSDEEAEAGVLQNLLGEHIILVRANDGVALQEILECFTYDAVFCSQGFGSRSWANILHRVYTRHPHLPVIFYSRNALEKEWLEVLDVGELDLLTPPSSGPDFLFRVGLSHRSSPSEDLATIENFWPEIASDELDGNMEF